jgi:hypothetical protein
MGQIHTNRVTQRTKSGVDVLYKAPWWIVKCTGNPRVLLDVPGPVPTWWVWVFTWVHMGGPWGYPDPYPQAGTRGFFSNVGGPA